MFGTDTTTSASTHPTFAPAGTGGYFTAGNIALSIQPTTISQDTLNIIEDELCNLVVSSGGTLTKANTTQVYNAIRTMIAVETSRAETEETTLATAISTETTRAEGEEATLAADIALKGNIAGQSWVGTQNFEGAGLLASYATSANEVVCLGQLYGPQAALSPQVGGEASSATATASMTVPVSGVLFAVGSRNNSIADCGSGGSAELYINGVPILSDTTQLSTCHMGCLAISAGDAVNATYTASTTTVAFSVQVLLVFVPVVQGT